MDYQEISSSTFALTLIETNHCIEMTIVDDTVFEETENLTMTLFYTELLSNKSINISPDTATISINDDDGNIVLFIYMYIHI